MKVWLRPITLSNSYTWCRRPTEIGAKAAPNLVRVFWRKQSKREGYFASFIAVIIMSLLLVLIRFGSLRRLSKLTAVFYEESVMFFHFRTGSAAAQMELLAKMVSSTFYCTRRNLSVKQGNIGSTIYCFRDRSGFCW